MVANPVVRGPAPLAKVLAGLGVAVAVLGPDEAARVTPALGQRPGTLGNPVTAHRPSPTPPAGPGLVSLSSNQAGVADAAQVPCAQVGQPDRAVRPPERFERHDLCAQSR